MGAEHQALRTFLIGLGDLHIDEVLALRSRVELESFAPHCQ
jgi:hypothetical protein